MGRTTRLDLGRQPVASRGTNSIGEHRPDIGRSCPPDRRVKKEQNVQNHQYSEDEAAIRNVIMQMTENFNKHNAQEMASVFTIDGDLVNVHGIRLNSRSTIEAGLARMLKSDVPTATLRTVDVEVRFIRPDVAIAHVTNELSDQANPGEQPVPQHHELSIRVFVKETGVWRVAAFHNTIKTGPEGA